MAEGGEAAGAIPQAKKKQMEENARAVLMKEHGAVDYLLPTYSSVDRRCPFMFCALTVHVFSSVFIFNLVTCHRFDFR